MKPLADSLVVKGFEIVFTARRFSITIQVCRMLGLPVVEIGGSPATRSKLRKSLASFSRAAALVRHFSGSRPALALSHGSRSQVIAARLMGVTCVCLDDYEYSDQSLVPLMNALIVPQAIPAITWGRHSSKVLHYPGIKENIYLHGWKLPDHLPARQAIILLRPEGTTAHYYSEKSTRLLSGTIDFLASSGDVHVRLVPRSARQSMELKQRMESAGLSCSVLEQIIPGPDLVWSSDLVIGGGGTMTREAAALGVRSYSFFSGRWGAVDRSLESAGRLVGIREPADLDKLVIKPEKRVPPVIGPESRDSVLGHLMAIVG
ncbi:DUF354 domain-containing protein [Candidatus Fermentibacteria bacterium]|nr:DUF354 domain-containing protein [Candidatus Fermentibacteria bacterium]